MLEIISTMNSKAYNKLPTKKENYRYSIMKNKILILAIIPLILIIGCKKEKDSEMTPKVKRLEGYTAFVTPYKFGQPSYLNKFKWESESYNKDGTIKQREYRFELDITSTSNFLCSETNTYEDGLLKEQIEIVISRHRKVFSYLDNLLSRIEVFDESGIIDRYDYEYSNNQISKMYEWYMFGTPSISMTHNYSYDTRGNMVKDSIDYSNSDYGILYWEYDSHNNMTKETYYIPSADKSFVQEDRAYIYLNDGRFSESIIPCWSNIHFQKFKYHYNEDGSISKIDVFRSTNGIYGSFEQTGIIDYEYNYIEE